MIDVANLAFSIPGPKGRARGRSRRWGPDLGAARDLFHHLGIEVTSFRVGLPLEPVEVLGVAARPEARRQTISRAWQWLGEQRAVHGDELVQPLPGASDGNGELGVDAACVLEAIAVSWDPTVDAVIVMSEDTDVMVAQDYVTDTPILAAGRFGSRQRQALRAEHRGWIDLRSLPHL